MRDSDLSLQKATLSETTAIWNILQQAIEQRRRDGSEQWQNGYPNEQTVVDDLRDGYGYVLVQDQVIIGYAAIIFGIEPAYNDIKGNWITQGDYVAVHRVAIADAAKGKGMATRLFLLIEDLCRKQNVYSIKVDTNFDNIPMLKVLDKLHYIYCGEIFFGGAPRKAYEKVLPHL
jgi:GNAT superfamily N-acetyltransferase